MKRFRAVLLFSILSLAVLCAGQQKRNREFQLPANSDDFWRLFDRESKLPTLASGFGFTEGPVWDREGFVIVSDEVANNSSRFTRMERKRSSFLSAIPTATRTTANSGSSIAPAFCGPLFELTVKGNMKFSPIVLKIGDSTVSMTS